MTGRRKTEYGDYDRAGEIRRRIMECLIENGRLMISDLSELCGYSVPTVTKYIDGLMDAGLVTTAGKRSLTRGKKPMLYMTRDDAEYFIGVDIQQHALMICAMNLSGAVIAETSLPEMVYSNTPPLFGNNVRNGDAVH